MGMTIRQANEVLRHLKRDGVYASLHTGPPGEDGLNEVTGGGYGRQEVEFGEPTDGAMTSVDVVEFELLPSVTVTHIGLWNRQTDGGLRWSSALDVPIPIRDRGTFRITAGDLQIQLRA